MKGKVYDFCRGFLLFIKNKDVTERDIKGEENKIKQFLKDIGYKQRGDTKSDRSNFIRRMLSIIVKPTSQVISMPTRKNIDVILWIMNEGQEEKNKKKEMKNLITRLINK